MWTWNFIPCYCKYSCTNKSNLVAPRSEYRYLLWRQKFSSSFIPQMNIIHIENVQRLWYLLVLVCLRFKNGNFFCRKQIQIKINFILKRILFLRIIQGNKRIISEIIKLWSEADVINIIFIICCSWTIKLRHLNIYKILRLNSQNFSLIC